LSQAVFSFVCFCLLFCLNIKIIEPIVCSCSDAKKMMATSVVALSLMALPLVTAFRTMEHGSQKLSQDVDASRYEYRWKVTVVGSTFKELTVNTASMQAGMSTQTAAESASTLEIKLKRTSTNPNTVAKIEASALGLPLQFLGELVHGTPLAPGQKSPIEAPLQNLQINKIGELGLKGSVVPHVADITGSVKDDYSSIDLTVNFKPVARGAMRTLFYTPMAKAILKLTIGEEELEVALESS